MWKSSTEISNSIFYPLKSWAEATPGNWNILLGSGIVLLLVGMILMFGFQMKIGKADERTNQISLRSAYILLLGVVFCDVVFPKEYMWQIFFLFKYSLAFGTFSLYINFFHKKTTNICIGGDGGTCTSMLSTWH